MGSDQHKRPKASEQPLALSRWAASCTVLPLARMVALQTAVSAESCYQMCRLARERVWFRLAEGTMPVSRWRCDAFQCRRGGL